MSDIEKHRRINEIFLAPLERPALAWLAGHMPKWVTPDILTGVGILGAILISLSYWLTNLNPNFLWLASLGFVINWFGDSLDGTLARFRKIERPRYGFFIDHAVDAFAALLIFLGMGISPYVKFELACLALIAYLLVSIVVYLRTAVRGEFVISYAGLGPTEMRVVAILANAVVFILGNPPINLFSISLSIYDLVAIAIILILFIIFVTSAIGQARIIAREDP